jgi:F420H(2)-dependent quinone reductase
MSEQANPSFRHAHAHRKSYPTSTAQLILTARRTDLGEDGQMPVSATRLKRFLIRKGLKTLGGLHKALYRASGGRVGARIWGLSVLLLTTTGRKTDKLRTTPLCFLPDGDDLVVVASNGGMDWFPSWWLNLLHEPRATIQVGRTERTVRAREATSEERARLWTEVTRIAPGYLKYQQRTRREIPLGILQPTDSS